MRMQPPASAGRMRRLLVLPAVACWRWPAAAGRRPRTTGVVGVVRDQRADRHADRVRRRIADRRLHRARQPAGRPTTPTSTSGSTSPAAPAWPPRSPRARRPTCSPRRNQAQMKVVTDAGLQAGDPPVFTENVLRDRRPEGQPGQRHRAGRLREAGPDPGRLRARRALRRRGGKGLPRGRASRPCPTPRRRTSGRRSPRCSSARSTPRWSTPPTSSRPATRSQGIEFPRGRAGDQRVPDLHR